MRILPFALLVAALPAAGGAAEICVRNATDEQLLFLAEGAGRTLELIEPGGQLCGPEADAGNSRIGVFADADTLEGCTRLTRAGQVEILEAFTEYDNCEWADTPRGF